LGAGVQARHMTSRSPLEDSPGYYPPNDPESLSVIRGRRDAPEVRMDLTGGERSLTALGRALAAAVAAKDERGLHELRVTQKEFEVLCWPEFPESRPITHIPASEAWGFSTAQSLAGASRTVAYYGGRPLTFLRIDYGRLQPFRNFRLYRDVRILVRDTQTGQLIALKFAPSILERNGVFKALIYKD